MEQMKPLQEYTNLFKAYIDLKAKVFDFRLVLESELGFEKELHSVLEKYDEWFKLNDI